MVSKLSEIWSGLFIPYPDPGSGSWIFTHPWSRIQSSKRHRIRNTEKNPKTTLIWYSYHRLLFDSHTSVTVLGPRVFIWILVMLLLEFGIAGAPIPDGSAGQEGRQLSHHPRHSSLPGKIRHFYNIKAYGPLSSCRFCCGTISPGFSLQLRFTRHKQLLAIRYVPIGFEKNSKSAMGGWGGGGRSAQ